MPVGADSGIFRYGPGDENHPADICFRKLSSQFPGLVRHLIDCQQMVVIGDHPARLQEPVKSGQDAKAEPQPGCRARGRANPATEITLLRRKKSQRRVLIPAAIGHDNCCAPHVPHDPGFHCEIDIIPGQTGGLKTVTWNGTDSRGLRAASGVYFYPLKTGQKTLVRKIAVIK